MKPARLIREHNAALEPLNFSAPVSYVYNPLDYARAAFKQYVELYGAPPVQTLLLGMNPGPWGMAQTGVPFGEVSLVRDWLGIDAKIGKPDREHPKRPVQGFACERSEVSGARLWGWGRDRFRTPKAFFKKFFVLNYCPLSFMEEGGKNITPDKLPAEERDPLIEICDRFLVKWIDYLQPTRILGIGTFAEKRVRLALGKDGIAERELQIGRILHPSPASPIANRGWAPQAEKQLRELGALS